MMYYIAAPLCSEAEREFNLKVTNFVEALGYSAYLPQRDGGILTDMVSRGIPEDDVRKELFLGDLKAMDNSDAILIVLDGRTVDEGACFELGYMYALDKLCLGFKTDTRSYIRGRNNLMLDRSLSAIANTWDELRSLLLSSSILD